MSHTEKPSTIAIAEAGDDGAFRFLSSLKSKHLEFDLRTIDGPVNSDNTEGLDDQVTVLSVFVDSRVDVTVLDACPNLQLIATRSTGFDHIDVAECRRRGIAVANVPTYGANTVAEHTFALILALSRNVHRAWMRTQKRDFSIEGLQGIDLRDRTLGVVGTGNIGLHVVKIARGFGMRVIASDLRPQPLIAEVLGFEYVALERLFAEADIVTLHAPLMASTEKMINRQSLSQFRRGALLINTSRGGLIDTQALLWALDEGILGGAGLDVLEGEQLLSEDQRMLMAGADEGRLRLLFESQMLLERENVVVTPHMAFDSVEAVQRIADTTATNIASFLTGDPINLVS